MDLKSKKHEGNGMLNDENQSWDRWKIWIISSIKEVKDDVDRLSGSLNSLEKSQNESFNRIEKKITRISSEKSVFVEILKIASPFALFLVYDILKVIVIKQ